MNTNEKFYGKHLSHMETVKSKAVSLASLMSTFSGIKSAAHIVSRIKTPESMTKKIQNDNLPVNHHSALAVESDAIGVRIIVESVADVYAIYENLKRIKSVDDKTSCRVIHVKDYIKHPKESGYRSLHVIMGFTSGDPDFPEMKVEFQLRTSIMDCWASLEHLAQYKQVIELTPDVLDMLDTYRHAADMEMAQIKEA